MPVGFGGFVIDYGEAITTGSEREKSKDCGTEKDMLRDILKLRKEEEKR